MNIEEVPGLSDDIKKNYVISSSHKSNKKYRKVEKYILKPKQGTYSERIIHNIYTCKSCNRVMYYTGKPIKRSSIEYNFNPYPDEIRKNELYQYILFDTFCVCIDCYEKKINSQDTSKTRLSIQQIHKRGAESPYFRGAFYYPILDNSGSVIGAIQRYFNSDKDEMISLSYTLSDGKMCDEIEYKIELMSRPEYLGEKGTHQKLVDLGYNDIIPINDVLEAFQKHLEYSPGKSLTKFKQHLKEYNQ